MVAMQKKKKKWKYIILPGETEEVIFELNLEGGRRILKVRAMAEWGIVSWAKNEMGKGQEKEKKKEY